MAIWPFQPSRENQHAARLLAAVTEASRRAALFGPGRIPDTLEGRFEAMALHGALAMMRLQLDPAAAALAQAFADAFFRAVDAGLREAGVGDLAVPKRMHKLAGAYYGRLEAYRRGIETGDREVLAAALARNVFGDDSHVFAPVLADYAFCTAQTQAGAQLEDLFSLTGWPPPTG